MIRPKGKSKNFEVYVEKSFRGYELPSEVGPFIAKIREAAEGLREATVEMETVYEYGNEFSRLNVRGWRDATLKEVADHLAERRRVELQAAERDEKLATELKRRRPDLFQ